MDPSHTVSMKQSIHTCNQNPPIVTHKPPVVMKHDVASPKNSYAVSLEQNLKTETIKDPAYLCANHRLTPEHCNKLEGIAAQKCISIWKNVCRNENINK